MARLLLYSGHAHPQLAAEIADSIGMPLGTIEVSRFADGEIFVQIVENVRGADVFIIQPTCSPVNENLMELLIIIDALKRASAAQITAALPYYGYARQDRKVQPRVPITAKLVADLLTAAGAHRILAMDLHAGQIQGFFNIPVDHLYATPVQLEYFRERAWHEETVVVSPDAGGVERARVFAKYLGTSLAVIDKRRVGPDEAKVMHLVGDVKGKDVIIIDDIVDTAGTLVQAAEALKARGARWIYASCTHPVLSGPAIERIEASSIEELVVTNTIPLGEKSSKKLTVLSVAPLLGKAICRIQGGESVSSLFV